MCSKVSANKVRKHFRASHSDPRASGHLWQTLGSNPLKLSLQRVPILLAQLTNLELVKTQSDMPSEQASLWGQKLAWAGMTGQQWVIQAAGKQKTGGVVVNPNPNYSFQHVAVCNNRCARLCVPGFHFQGTKVASSSSSHSQVPPELRLWFPRTAGRCLWDQDAWEAPEAPRSAGAGMEASSLVARELGLPLTDTARRLSSAPSAKQARARHRKRRSRQEGSPSFSEVPVSGRNIIWRLHHHVCHIRVSLKRSGTKLMSGRLPKGTGAEGHSSSSHSP